MTRDKREFVEWFIWVVIFGSIVAGTLWVLTVHP